ncbi:MAG: glutamyl-tRNA reductase [Deltaproteobacteria bacterium]|jgi:glutamyl-tRNA reductase|nr:glutamyl-tRNA reductase [Deltaproteobacteria bacterium]
MDIVLIGLGHREAPVSVREKLAGGGLDGEGLFRLCAESRLREVLKLSTCNRFELIGVTDELDPCRLTLTDLLIRISGLERHELEPRLHYITNLEAVNYLFKVTAGLDSQVLGENQILGQVKDAFREATQYRTVGPVVNKLFHKSFQTAKRVRTETGLANGSVSVASAAVETALLTAGGLADARALVLGTGEMAAATAAHLRAKGAVKLTVAGRALERVEEFARRFGAEKALLADLPALLPKADVVFTALSGPAPALTKRLLADLGGRRLLVLDLGLPRNVEETAAQLPGVTLKNIDDFQDMVRRNRGARLQEAQKAEAIVAEEVEKFGRWLSSLSASPTIKDLIALAEEARSLEMERTLGRHQFSPEQVEALEAMGRSLVRRILHNPLVYAKGSRRHGRADANISMVRRVFGLDS